MCCYWKAMRQIVLPIETLMCSMSSGSAPTTEWQSQSWEKNPDSEQNFCFSNGCTFATSTTHGVISYIESMMIHFSPHRGFQHLRGRNHFSFTDRQVNALTRLSFSMRQNVYSLHFQLPSKLKYRFRLNYIECVMTVKFWHTEFQTLENRTDINLEIKQISFVSVNNKRCFLFSKNFCIKLCVIFKT